MTSFCGRTAAEIAVAEGIETALSFQQETNIPTRAAISAPGMKAIMLPPEVRAVVIAADNGAAGEEAAAGR